MTFRTARSADAPVLAAVSIVVWLGTNIQRGVSTELAEFALRNFTSSNLLALIDNPREHFIVSESRDGLDGFIRLTKSEALPASECSTLAISTLYVQPRHQGKGMGAALQHQGLDFVWTAGTASVWLTTKSDNKAAKAFYFKRGFEHVEFKHFHVNEKAYLNELCNVQLADTYPNINKEVIDGFAGGGDIACVAKWDVAQCGLHCCMGSKPS